MKSTHGCCARVVLERPFYCNNVATPGFYIFSLDVCHMHILVQYPRSLCSRLMHVYHHSRDDASANHQHHMLHTLFKGSDWRKMMKDAHFRVSAIDLGKSFQVSDFYQHLPLSRPDLQRKLDASGPRINVLEAASMLDMPPFDAKLALANAVKHGNFCKWPVQHVLKLDDLLCLDAYSFRLPILKLASSLYQDLAYLRGDIGTSIAFQNFRVRLLCS